MTNRIKEVARFYNLTSTAFADQVEVPRPVISHIFSERNRPSLEVIQKIGQAFPELQLEWLLYGKGEMLKNEAKPASNKITPEEQIKTPMPEPKIEPIGQGPEKIKIKSDPVLVQQQQKMSGKKTVKIVFFYDDNSFQEFKP